MDQVHTLVSGAGSLPIVMDLSRPAHRSWIIPIDYAEMRYWYWPSIQQFAILDH